MKSCESLRQKKNPDEKSVLPHFMMVNSSETVLQAIIMLIDSNPCAAASLFYLAARSDSWNKAEFSYEQIAEATGFCRRQVVEGMNLLVEYGFVLKINQAHKNAYYVNAYFSWKNSLKSRYVAITESKTMCAPIVIPGQKPESIQNEKFVQISANSIALKLIALLAKTNPCALKIIFFMAIKCNDLNRIEITYDELCTVTMKSRRTVASAIAVLKKHNLIDGRMNGNINRYYLSTEFCFKNKAKNYEKFEYVGALQLSSKLDDGVDAIVAVRNTVEEKSESKESVQEETTQEEITQEETTPSNIVAFSSMVFIPEGVQSCASHADIECPDTVHSTAQNHENT